MFVFVKRVNEICKNFFDVLREMKLTKQVQNGIIEMKIILLYINGEGNEFLRYYCGSV